MRRPRSLAAGLLALAILLGPSDLLAGKRRKRRRPARRAPVAAANFDTKLPVLGTRLFPFPTGPGKPIAEAGCLSCHSAEMVSQQRLSEKQWAAEVNKMVGWGAAVPQDKRAELVNYLVKNFGPDNDKFEPVVTRPVGK